MDEEYLTLKEQHKRYWKYPDRNCKRCRNYPCFVGIENSKVEFAKYGCFKYDENPLLPITDV